MVCVDGCTTVASLMTAFEKTVPLPLGEYALLHRGAPMLPQTLLADYGPLGDIIYVVRARLLCAPKQNQLGMIFTRGQTPVTATLTSVAVTAEVAGFLAAVRIQQVFLNDLGTDTEAVYNFPMDPKAAVYDLEITTGGRTIRGEVMERQAATAMYETAVRAGHGAYLAEESAASADVYNFALGNVLARATVTVCLRYVVEMPLEAIEGHDGAPTCRFQLPASIAPRYASLPGLGNVSMELLGSAAAATPYPFTLSVNVDALSKPQFVSHPSTVLDADGRTVISAVDGLTADFVLLLAVPAADVPAVAYERNGDVSTAMVTLFPPMIDATLRQPAEFVFVVDCSGSMEGERIAHAREALALCLRSIPVDSRFQLVKFGDTHASCFADGAVEYNNGSLAAADAFVAALRGNMGGTELHATLRSVLSAPAAGLPKQIFLLTDGAVHNTRAVVDMCRKSSARIFTFGIGAAASAALVKGVAEASGASWEMLGDRERLEPKVMRQFARAAAPAVTDLAVLWPAGCVLAFPTAASQRVLYSGTRVLLYGVFTATAPGEVTVSVNNTPVWTAPFNPVAAREGKALQAMAVKARLTTLENATEEAAAAATLATALSIRYGVVCKSTSLLAVETRTGAEPRCFRAAAAVKRSEEDTENNLLGNAGYASFTSARSDRFVGRRLESCESESEEEGVDGCFDSDADLLGDAGCGVLGAHPSKYGGGGSFTSARSDRFVGRTLESSEGGVDSDDTDCWRWLQQQHSSVIATSKAAAGPVGWSWSTWDERRRMQALVSLQRADGSWQFDQALYVILSSHLPLCTEAKEVTDAQMTTLVLEYMRTYFASLLMELQLVLAKGDAWVAKDARFPITTKPAAVSPLPLELETV